MNLIEYRPMLVALGCKLTRNASLAEDVADQTIGQALVNLSKWRGDNFPAWLRSIAVNIIRHNARDLKARAPVNVELERAKQTKIRTPLQNAISNEIMRGVESALDSLTEKQREAFKLAEVDGLPYEEVAVKLGVRCGAARALGFRARAALTKKLERFIA